MGATLMREAAIGSVDGTNEKQARSRDGTVDAFDRWFDDVLPRVFGYFLPRVGGRVHVAEDLTQETMLSAIRANGFATADEPLAWLFGIARHKLLDHYRRHYRDRNRHEPLGSDFEETTADTRHLPELRLESLHVRDAIIATLDQLPPRQRSALVLRYLDGLDVAAVAAMLDVSIHAAESLLARGRRAFRTRYLQATGDSQ